MINAEDLFTIVDQLPLAEKQRLIEHVKDSIKREEIDSAEELDWHKKLAATCGILANDPIERPPQLPLQERDPIE